MGYIGNPLDPWGAADPREAYGACFGAMAASGAYDVLVLVHDFPYRSLPSEVATANDVTFQLLGGDPRPAGHPAGLRLAHLGRAAAGDEGAARRRGRRRAAAARRASRPSARSPRSLAGRRAAERRAADGPWRTTWPALAADRTTYGNDARTMPSGPTRRREPRRPTLALSERESLDLLRAAGITVTPASPSPTPDAAVRAAARARRRPRRAQARCRRARPQERPRRRRPRAASATRRSAARPRDCSRRRDATASRSAASSWSRWPTPGSS